MSILNLHIYWMINSAILLSYLIAKIFSKFKFKNQTISQIQQLKFSRQLFLITLLIFILLPFLIMQLPMLQTRTSSFQPLLKHASGIFLNPPISTQLTMEKIQSSFSWPTIDFFFSYALLIGLLVLFTDHMKSILTLRKLTQQAFCYRKIKNIHILFSEQTQAPFCWSSLKTHYVLIPQDFIERNADLKLAIAHELQHLRQGDTYWLHFITFIKLFCFWNPFIILWNNWFIELQEFACDESLVLLKKIQPVIYAQCLLETAIIVNQKSLPQGALGIMGLSHRCSNLKRRINMIFNYPLTKNKKPKVMLAYLICILTASSCVYALTQKYNAQTLSAQQLTVLAEKSHLKMTITPEVITAINNFRQDNKAREFMTTALKRMEQYRPYIQMQLQNNNMPMSLLALPLVESGYNNEVKSNLSATGIWQFIPSTAKHFNLTINSERDDRLNTELATHAAITYLKLLYSQFHHWKLAVIAYEIGEDHTAQLIEKLHSRDPWVIARSPDAPLGLKEFLGRFDAALLILNNPTLVAK